MPKKGRPLSRAYLMAPILPSTPALAEAGRDDQAVGLREPRGEVQPRLFQRVALDPLDVDAGVVGDAAVLERLGDGDVGVAVAACTCRPRRC